MKILIFGAGVLGSLYAAKLTESGEDVTLLARGKRLSDLKEHGIVLEEVSNGNHYVVEAKLTDTLTADDTYDLIMVLVRKNQLESALEVIGKNQACPSVLVMVNNAAGPDSQIAAVGAERLLLGFPGAGGERDGHIVRSFMVEGEWGHTMIGELDGLHSDRVVAIARVLDKAGLNPMVEPDMTAWLKSHVALVSPIANAIYMAEGNIRKLAADPAKMRLMLCAMREGFNVLRKLGIASLPKRLVRMVRWVPPIIQVPMLRKGFSTPAAEMNMQQHANAAVDEMTQIAMEFKDLADESGIPTPAIDELRSYIPSL